MTELVAYCSVPDAETAARLARVLVEERLAACVSRVPGVVSTYRWQGRVCVDEECLLLIKTTEARLAALRERLVALHPYAVPELIAVPVVAGHAPYLDWLRAQVADAPAD